MEWGSTVNDHSEFEYKYQDPEFYAGPRLPNLVRYVSEFVPSRNESFNEGEVVEIESGGDASTPPHPPGSQMIFTYISLINRQKMEKSVKG